MEIENFSTFVLLCEVLEESIIMRRDLERIRQIIRKWFANSKPTIGKLTELSETCVKATAMHDVVGDYLSCMMLLMWLVLTNAALKASASYIALGVSLFAITTLRHLQGGASKYPIIVEHQ